MTSTFVSRGRRGTKLASTVVLRGRRGTHGTGWRAWSGFVACDAAALCVAGLALGDIHLRFTWQAWHKLASSVVLRGRRGTHGTYPQLLKGLKWYTQGSPEGGSRMVFFHVRPQPPDDLRPLNIGFYHTSHNHNRPQN